MWRDRKGPGQRRKLLLNAGKLSSPSIYYPSKGVRTCFPYTMRHGDTCGKAEGVSCHNRHKTSQVLSLGKISPNAILNAEGLASRNRHKPLPALSLGKVTAENTSIGGL